jgi:hypothetical protein
MLGRFRLTRDGVVRVERDVHFRRQEGSGDQTGVPAASEAHRQRGGPQTADRPGGGLQRLHDLVEVDRRFRREHRRGVQPGLDGTSGVGTERDSCPWPDGGHSLQWRGVSHGPVRAGVVSPSEGVEDSWHSREETGALGAVAPDRHARRLDPKEPSRPESVGEEAEGAGCSVSRDDDERRAEANDGPRVDVQLSSEEHRRDVDRCVTNDRPETERNMQGRDDGVALLGPRRPCTRGRRVVPQAQPPGAPVSAVTYPPRGPQRPVPRLDAVLACGEVRRR